MNSRKPMISLLFSNEIDNLDAFDQTARVRK